MGLQRTCRRHPDRLAIHVGRHQARDTLPGPSGAVAAGGDPPPRGEDGFGPGWRESPGTEGAHIGDAEGNAPRKASGRRENAVESTGTDAGRPRDAWDLGTRSLSGLLTVHAAVTSRERIPRLPPVAQDRAGEKLRMLRTGGWGGSAGGWCVSRVRALRREANGWLRWPGRLDPPADRLRCACDGGRTGGNRGERRPGCGPRGHPPHRPRPSWGVPHALPTARRGLQTLRSGSRGGDGGGSPRCLRLLRSAGPLCCS